MPAPDLAYAFDLPPEKAIAYFRAKGYQITWNWSDMWQSAHTKAFTVAKAMKLDLLEDIRGAVDKALAKGTTFDQFMNELAPTLKAKGWWGRDPQTGALLGSPHRLDTIFRTNMQTAYMAGRYAEMKEVAEDLPYWQYVAVMDSRTRPAHAALHGKVFHHSDAFWQTHYPPLGFRCRCRVRALSEGQFIRRGLTLEDGGPGSMVGKTVEVQGASRTVAGWRDANGEVHYTDPGWSYNPGKTVWDGLEKAFIERREKEMLAALKAAGKRAPSPFAHLKLSKTVKKDVEGAFSDPALDKIVRDAAKTLRSVNVSRRNGSQYTPALRRIDLGAATRKYGMQQRTFRHEVGHHIDYFLGSWPSAVSNTDAAFSAGMKALLGRIDADSDGYFIESMRGHLHKNAAVSDILDAVSHAKVYGEWGHFNSYYSSRPGGRERQVFANLVDIYGGSDDDCLDGRMFLEENAPELVVAFKRIMGI